MWFFSKKKYTEEDILELVSRIKEYNAGVIDEHLSKYIDNVYQSWKKK